MQYTVRTTIGADADTVWAVVEDLSAWPTWTPTFESVGSPGVRPALGLAVSVKQPGRRAVVYTVDRLEPGRRFRWSAQSPGVRQWADHVVTPVDAGSCQVELTFSMTGWLGLPM